MQRPLQRHTEEMIKSCILSKRSRILEGAFVHNAFGLKSYTVQWKHTCLTGAFMAFRQLNCFLKKPGGKECAQDINIVIIYT
jgi:hypothetical protein